MFSERLSRLYGGTVNNETDRCSEGKVENAKTKEEARDTIKEAGMLLDDEELEKVSGGGEFTAYNLNNRPR